MTDQSLGSPVSDAELSSFVTSTVRESQTRGCRTSLVLLGDIVDLLRSQAWSDLGKKGQYPWSATGKQFVNFHNSPAEACAVAVAQRVAERYGSFSKALAKHVKNGSLRVTYVPGNHDYMVQMSAKLRRAFVEFLCLDHDPQRQFPETFTSSDELVYALHGNAVDSVNRHGASTGSWAFGDAVVLRLVNRFPELSIERLGTGHDTEIGRALHEIDNVEPEMDIPLYVRWVVETYLRSAHERKVVLSTWNDVVDDLLALPHFADAMDTGVRAVRTGLALSKKLELVQLFAKFKDLKPDFGYPPDYHKEASNLAHGSPHARFVVFGHTHDPTLAPMHRVQGRPPVHYVNTGSWRRIVVRPSEREPGPFIGVRVAGYFSASAGAYELVRRWQAT